MSDGKRAIPRMAEQSYRSVVVSLLAGILLALTGCSVAMKPVRAVGLAQKDLVLQVTIDPDANDASPVAVDVVAVESKKVAAQVTGLSAQQWFAQRTDLQRMKGKQISVHSWEWVPGEAIPVIHVPGTTGSDAVVLFARYSTKGEHRAALPAVGRVVLQLKAEDFAIEVPGVPPAASQP